MSLQKLNFLVRHWLLSLTALVIIIIAFFATQHFLHKRQTPRYKTEIIQLGNLIQTVSANGTLNPVILVNVGTQVSGTVQKIYADYNSHVTQGQILLELDSKLFKAALMQSLASIAKAKASLELAKANEKRGFPLYQHGDISKQDWETLVQARKNAEADLGIAIATAAKDKTNLDYATIHSPVSGVVVDRAVDVGQTVAASFQTPVLFRIAQDLSKMQIDSNFAEADIANIKPGQEVDFTVDAFPNRIFKGVVKEIRLNPTIQQNVVTYDVVILVNNSDGILLPGMTAYVNIKTAEHQNIVTVPNVALRYRHKDKKTEAANAKIKPGSAILYKLIKQKPKLIICTLGISDSKNTEIKDCDLKPGDEVIVGDIAENQNDSTSSFRLRMF